MASDSALIILNPHAGRGRARRLVARLLKTAHAGRWDVTLRLTRHPGEERSLAAEARAQSWPLVIAAGGDGTVHGVVNGLLAEGATDTVLGHIPIGNGNDFARTIGLRGRSLEENFDLLMQGTVKKLDVGRAIGELFVNGLGVGFSAEVVRRLLEFKRLRGFPLYLAAVYRTFLSYRALELEVSTDEHCERGLIMMVEVTNGPTAGGGFRLTPKAVPDDGVLDVCVIRKVGLSRFLTRLPSVVRGRHEGLPEVTLFQSRHVRLSGKERPLTLHLDGELRTDVQDPVTVELIPQRLRVLCAAG